MALTGVQIFKLLPKTNCKKCGFPTCLAFAMKLAARQVSIDKCPDMSEEARQQLGEASAPPIRGITIGTGDKAVKMGEETVMFRHEKKFVNPTVFALNIQDSLDDGEIDNKVKEVLESEIERVGQKLRVEAISIEFSSNDASRYESVVKSVLSKAPDTPIVLNCSDVSAAEAAAKLLADKKPLLYGANPENYEAMAKIAKENKTSLGVKADNLEQLSELTEKIKALGVDDMVLDHGGRSAKEILELNTQIRRAALKKGFKPLGYPVINPILRDDPLLETTVAAIAICKYASLIILKDIEKWKNLALFTLRQNLYTDPQVPMQVEQKIYEIGEPKPDSPLLLTTNFSLTYFIVSGEIENSKVPSRLAVMDCEGLSVLTAWAAGKFTAAKIAQFIKESGIEEKVTRKELIIPGMVAILSGALEEKLPGWKIVVGPREANALPAFLKKIAA
ncbi:MAG: acetyl-CoA decarbonylase/synthase complex subunit gamma [Nitrospirae bacterium]|nr:MAG: acetyl-CoA decarbonylase/synthase complex subunit gamma [Nitrospirota bacterium]